MVDQPPILKEGDTYEKWRTEIVSWREHTAIELKRQALAVRAKLSGKVREAALRLDAADLNKKNGMSFLLDNLDQIFRKDKRRKWDVAKSDDSNLSATERARQRAAKLSAKLAAEGKYQTQPMSLLPQTISNPVDQFIKNKPTGFSTASNQAATIPTVKKLQNGGYFTEMDVNDIPERQFVTDPSLLERVSKQCGAAVTLRGKQLSTEDKRRSIISGIAQKPLSIMIHADVAAKVQVALHKFMDLITNCKKFGPNFTSNNQPSANYYVQDKIFVGLDDAHPDFNVNYSLGGDKGTNFGFIMQQSGGKVFLRGKRSGYLEHNSGRESFEALHIYISHPHQDGLDLARQLCENLIDTVHQQYQSWLQRKRNEEQREYLYSPSQNIHEEQYDFNAGQIEQVKMASTKNQSFSSATRYELTTDESRRLEVLATKEEYIYPPREDMKRRYDSNTVERNHLDIARPNRTHAHSAKDNINEELHAWSSDRNHQSATKYDDRVHGNTDQCEPNQTKRDRFRDDRNTREMKETPTAKKSHDSRHRYRPYDDKCTERDISKYEGKTKEEWRKKRKFSEDPKLMEGRGARNLREDSYEPKAEDVKPLSDAFLPPPPVPPLFHKKHGRDIRKDRAHSDLFKARKPLTIKKSTSGAIKMGALSSLTAYDGDSDED
ncbi:uncharacterized protein LOC130647864 isoform X1 [Hydractinia symbiolongicarpus]|uniref:uncharacterized protein LOC130647864 isoform X1 n=1 Tax=Hydractinia symbiolongicarpus TaxID=13093 RepID=UPI00254A2A66|nr:uncharacterized protein LOC130647864 isoform X1 [Hydractinia symbiolongicarpus]